MEDLGTVLVTPIKDRPSAETVLECLEPLTVTWKSPPPRADDDVQMDSEDKPRSITSYTRTSYFASSLTLVFNHPV